jgi:hypothetical protein
MIYKYLRIPLFALLMAFIVNCNSSSQNSATKKKTGSPTEELAIPAISATTTFHNQKNWTFKDNNQLFIVTIDSVLFGG